MKVCGVDPAAQSGVAFYDTVRPQSAIIARTMNVSGKDKTLSTKARLIAPQFRKLLHANGRPDLVIIEQPLDQVPRGASNAGLRSAHLLTGALLGVCGLLELTVETVAVNTWRAAMYKSSSKKILPPSFIDKDGNALWKAYAKHMCQLEHIEVSNSDEAEAVQIAIYGARCSAFAQKLKYEAAVA